MQNWLPLAITGIILLQYILSSILNILNRQSLNKPVPSELNDIYDQSAIEKTRSYLLENQRLSFISSTISTVIILFLLLGGGFSWLDEWVHQITENEILVTLLFFGLLFIANDIISLPFQIYKIFVIEEKYGFNKTTLQIFLTDKIKGYLLAALIGGGLLALLNWIFILTGKWFWLIAWLTVTAFSIFLNMFYTTWIVPLFNKLTPLEPGELRDEIQQLAQKAGFPLDDIYIIDSSKRSTKANAYFSGLGPKKHIILFDNLVKNYSRDELLAVLAHEIGHYKKKHTLKNLFISTAHTGLFFFLFGIMANTQIPAIIFGTETSGFHLALLGFILLYQPVDMFFGILFNAISRKFEYEADRFAATQFKAQPLIEALKKMTKDHLSHPNPHPAVVKLLYSHPPVHLRIKALKSVKQPAS